MRPSRSSVLPGLAGALTAGAGLVHAAAAGAHEGDGHLVVAFAVTAVVQVVLGAVLISRPGPVPLAAAVLVNITVAGAWVVSRMWGLPLLDGLRGPQPAGAQDVTATLMAVAAVAVATLALRHGRPYGSPRVSPVWALGLLPALIGMTTSHTHPDGQHHQPAQHLEPAAGALAGDGVLSGADSAHASEAELEAARALVLATRDAVRRDFPDEAAVLRAGYLSIGDGRFPGTFEHFVHADYLTDGQELDPARVESIVLENTGAGKRVASAMYILELGKTMADAPDVAGPLTVWHDHQNLCWDDSGARLAGLLVNGRCVPRGTFRPTPPMLHVWLQDHPCGPFAGIEGHGATCGAHHPD